MAVTPAADYNETEVRKVKHIQGLHTNGMDSNSTSPTAADSDGAIARATKVHRIAVTGLITHHIIFGGRVIAISPSRICQVIRLVFMSS